jgi:hypothetical protein
MPSDGSFPEEISNRNPTHLLLQYSSRYLVWMKLEESLQLPFRQSVKLNLLLLLRLQVVWVGREITIVSAELRGRDERKLGFLFLAGINECL